MANSKIYKEISAVPTPYTPNAIYYIRIGLGIDMYMADSTGTNVYKLNVPSIKSTTITANTDLGASTYNTFISNGSNLQHTLPSPSSFTNEERTVRNINSTVMTLIGVISGDTNPYLYGKESITFWSDGTNIYYK